MNKLFPFLILMALSIQSFAQKHNDAQRINQQDIERLRQKAKWQLATALVMTGVGTSMMMAGLLVAANAGTGAADNAAGTLFSSGVLLDLGSLGCSIPSHINRKKARNASMSISNQRMPGTMVPGSLKMRSQPAFTLSIPLGR